MNDPGRALRRLRIPALALAMLGFSGCQLGGSGSSIDEGTLRDIRDTLADGIRENAVHETAGILENLIVWSDTFVPPEAREDVAEWNADGDQAWIISGERTVEDGEISGTVTYRYWLQFRNGDHDAQRWLDDNVDQVGVILTATSQGNWHPRGEVFRIEYHWRTLASLTALRNPDGSAVVVGAGDLSGVSSTAVDGETLSQIQDATWQYDLLAAPDEACVTGGLSGSWDIYDFGATFDGSGGVESWLERDGARIGMFTYGYDCSTP